MAAKLGALPIDELKRGLREEVDPWEDPGAQSTMHLRDTGASPGIRYDRRKLV
ncbi:MAG: hypothetical protein H0X71_01795 [Rubrobacter sp.]|nr:hypothetical protein [Rubrobacter sp.]